MVNCSTSSAVALYRSYGMLQVVLLATNGTNSAVWYERCGTIVTKVGTVWYRVDGTVFMDGMDGTARYG